MPLQATSGAASYDAFGGGVPVVPAYIEEVFSTYLYTGDGSTQTVPNDIDLLTKGGLVWIKNRTNGGANYEHALTDTARGATYELRSNATDAQTSDPARLTSFNSNGFSVGTSIRYNQSGDKYASWSFRKQPKFFDVVTYTGDGTNDRNVSHNLGSAPGCYIVKATSTTSDWYVYHRGLASASWFIRLNTTAAQTSASSPFDSAPTSTTFNVWHNSGTNSANASGVTYVAYLFAHNAGGFGLTGTDNVISCGSYTGNGSTSGPTVTLGYEPQWVMVKRSDSTGEWLMFDVMRSMSVTGSRYFDAQSAGAEGNIGGPSVVPTATGFQLAVDSEYTSLNDSGGTYIYIAIRRGPMKVPTSGTSVFGLSARTGTGANATVTGGQTDDAVIIRNRGATIGDLFASRLTGTGYLDTTSTAAEVAAGTTILQANPWDVMDGVKVGTTSTITNASSNTFINYLFKRAPSVFDVVCYTGTGSNTTVSHNLGVVPELMIVKRRDTTSDWQVYSSVMANTEYLTLNGTAAKATGATRWNSTTPTSSVFSVGTSTTTNASAGTYIAYLFATCAGVCKVGTYAGTGTTIQVDCGFTSGARFVMIRVIDDGGNWWIWDTARGIVSGNDPYFKINSTDPEVTNEDLLDPYSAGFQVSTGIDQLNGSGFNYLFLAIA